MEKTRICKHNMKLYPIFRMLSYDFLFFYTINVLFLTQIKHISPSSVIVIDAFYSIFLVVFQFPASFILEKIGRKRSLVLGTLFNSIYLLVVIFSRNLVELILAEMAAALGYALKDIASPSLLNESIPVTKRKSEIFAKLSGKAMSGYYILNAISLIISGFLYNINGYIPMLLALGVILLTFILANSFYEPIELSSDSKEKVVSNENNFKESLKFIFSSGRLKSLILYSSVMLSLINILASTEIYLLEELDVSSGFVGVAFAVLGIISGIAAKKQNEFHIMFRNKSLTVLGLTISIACIVSTLGFVFELPFIITLIIILVAYVFKYIVVGIYQVLISKYLSNFTNEQIDSKIYTTQIFVNSIISAILGVAVSMFLDYFGIVNTMLLSGIGFLILFVITIIYMRNKLGLKPTEYSKEETKYSKVEGTI